MLTITLDEDPPVPAPATPPQLNSRALRNLPELTGVHRCVSCLKPIDWEEFDGGDGACRGCALIQRLGLTELKPFWTPEAEAERASRRAR